MPNSKFFSKPKGTRSGCVNRLLFMMTALGMLAMGDQAQAQETCQVWERSECIHCRNSNDDLSCYFHRAPCNDAGQKVAAANASVLAGANGSAPMTLAERFDSSLKMSPVSAGSLNAAPPSRPPNPPRFPSRPPRGPSGPGFGPPPGRFPGGGLVPPGRGYPRPPMFPPRRPPFRDRWNHGRVQAIARQLADATERTYREASRYDYGGGYDNEQVIRDLGELARGARDFAYQVSSYYQDPYETESNYDDLEYSFEVARNSFEHGNIYGRIQYEFERVIDLMRELRYFYDGGW